MNTDPVLDTLLLPFREQTLSPSSGPILFLRAREGAALKQLGTVDLTCEQSFKPQADALERAGYRVEREIATGSFATVLIAPPRQKEEARSLYARAVSLTQPGGTIVAGAANDEGAKSQESDLKLLLGSVTSQSKNKCRVFWGSVRNDQLNQDVLKEWRTLDAPRSICDGRFRSRPGIFAWDRIDAASALLAKHLPTTLRGRAADLGAGFGYLSIELLNRNPGIVAIDLYEAEHRALDLARSNLDLSPLNAERSFYWHDVTTGLKDSYDVIVMNPPFHAQGSQDRPDIGRRFIAVAAQALKPGGQLWLVANRHLPYEAILDANFGSVRVVTQEHGFKVIEGIKAAPSSDSPRGKRR